MTESESARLVAVLIAAFPSSKATTSTSSAYESMLRDLDYTATNAAVARLLATLRFMPSIAEIREAALSLTSGDIRPGGDAWGSVLAAVKGAGAHRVPGVDFVFADPVVAKAVEALGWRELCLSEDLTADRARFIALYDQLAKSHRVEQLSGSLPAVQRFRALEAARAEQAKPIRGATSSIGKLLSLVTASNEDES